MAARGEVDKWKLGGRSLYPWPSIALRACGVRTATELGEFVKAAGISSLAELLDFLGGGAEGETK